jgi:hypothetical protein
MNTPVSTTVISLEVAVPPGAGSLEASAKFERTVEAVARQLGAVAKEPSGFQLTLTLPPDGTVGPLLHRLVDAFTEFESQCKPMRVRAVVHYGTVFATGTEGKTSYLGSAIRAAQSALKRAGSIAGLVATPSFAAYCAEFNPPSVVIEAKTDAAAADGLSLVSLKSKSAEPVDRSTELPSGNPEFLLYLKKRLAEDLGPFAGPLTESARRNCSTARSLVAAMALEIDDKQARKKFESDLSVFVNGQGHS